MDLQSAACEAGLILPDEVTMLGKTLLNLDKVVELLDSNFDPTEAIRRHAAQIVSEHGSEKLSWECAYETLLESAELMRNLPKRANEISRRVAESDFRFHVDAINEEEVISGMQKIANRITAGLVIAALILAAARLMTLKTGWTILGYPGLALCFFSLSVVLGGVLLWQIMVTDRSSAGTR